MDRSHSLSLLVALVLLVHTVQGVVVSLAQGRQPWNIKGDVLVLDVSSLTMHGNHQIGPSITSADICQASCTQTSGCSGWTFCSKEAGCGSGCDQYVAQHKSFVIPMGEVKDPSVPTKEWFQVTSVQAFGPWGPTAKCQATSKWPYGMCTLKVLRDAGKPEYYNQNAGEGWISGWIKVPSQCKGTTPQACQRCLQTTAQDRCLTCALNSKLKISLLEQVMNGDSPQAYDNCATCYSTADPDKCTDCLFNKKPCAACASVTSQPGQNADILSCIDCSNKYGSGYTVACAQCAALDAKSGAVGKCVACIARASKACSASGSSATCWNPDTAPGACATCTAANYETCVSCVERRPYSSDCETCANVGDAAKQTKCYNCVKTAASSGTACSDCISFLNDSKQVDQCYACVANPKTSAEGRSWCFGCQNWCNTYDTRGKCGTCLQTKTSDYQAACACKD